MTTQKTIGIAALLIIVGSALFYVLLFRQSDGEAMFSDYYEPYPDMISLDDRSDEKNTGAIRDMMAKYKKGDYRNALSLMNEHLAQHPDDENIRFYRGIVKQELDKPEEAIDDFEKVVIGADELDVHATWYLGLTYMRLGQHGRAGIYLKELIRNNTKYDRSAQTIMDRLELDPQQISDALYYKVTDDSQYLVYQTSNNEETHQSIDERTLYLECRYLTKLPAEISYTQFKPLALEQQRALLKYGQKEIWMERADNVGQETKNNIEQEAGALLTKLGNVKNKTASASSSSEEDNVIAPVYQNDKEPANLVELANHIQIINMRIEQLEDTVEARKKKYTKTAQAYQSELQKVAEGLQQQGKDDMANTIMDHAPAFSDYLETYFWQTKKAHLGQDTVPRWFVEECQQSLSTLRTSEKPDGMPEDVFRARKKLHEVISTVLSGSQKRLMADKGVRDEDDDQHVEVTEYETLVQQLADVANSKVKLRELQEQKRQTVANLVKLDNFTSSLGAPHPTEVSTSFAEENTD